MSNNENSSNNHENNNNLYPAEWLASKFTLQIADNSGHTTVDNLTIYDAMEEIIKNAESNARWVFINGKKFEFYAGSLRTEENNQKLKDKLLEQANPEIMLTGILAGGRVILRNH